MSLTVNGTLNAINSVANGILNGVGEITAPFDRYQGELISIETGLGPAGGVAMAGTMALGRLSAGIRAGRAINAELNAANDVLHTIDPAAAVKAQLSSGYAADAWGVKTLKSGDVVYSLSPNKNPEFFTDLQTLQSTHWNSEGVSSVLQIKPHSVYGTRPDVTGYRVLESISVPSGTASANLSFGVGGGNQFFLQNSSKYLEPIATTNLWRHQP